MAGAVVSYVLHKFDDVALNRAIELYNVSNKVQPMLVKLDLIQGFLKDADSKRNQNESVKRWVKKVTDVAHRIEDAMDIFQAEIQENRPESFGIISKLKMVVKHPKRLHRFFNEIKEIQETLKTIHEGTIQLGITNTGGDSEETIHGTPSRPTKLHDIDVFEVVGFQADKDKIIGHLLDENISRRTVLSIVGIGGLGKTTLAKKVYESAKLKKQFDCRTWLSISQKFNLANLLREILYSIEPKMKEKIPAVTDDDLPMELNRSLGNKRYLITLDDVWTTDLWAELKIALPDMNNGSRVLITSRSLDVAIAADPQTSPHKLPFLTEKESLDLLLRKAFPNNQPDNCPHDLKNVAKQLTKKCGGLPLALIVLGGILSRKERIHSAWHKVELTMDWHNDEGKKCSQVLAMSYEDLPYHLKPCFLYSASFPEDYKIHAKHVTRMWIAEGFIPNNGVGTLEDKAEDYIEELVQRCLVQVIEKSWNGYCKYCNMHDLLRDLAIHEAKEENFFTVFSKAEDDSQLNIRVTRRAAVQFCTPIEYEIHSTSTRSLLFFGQYISNYAGFRLLRVLIIERAKIVTCEMLLKGLIHLRYLGFRYCIELPKDFMSMSFSSVKYVETFELMNSRFPLPNRPNSSLWQIPTLRHVICNRILPLECSLSKWDHLKNLQTLKWVRLLNIPKLECNLNLRKMGLLLDINFWHQCGSTEEGRKMLKGLLKRMKHLIYLGLYSLGEVPFPIGSTSDIPSYGNIQCLFLEGMWSRGIVLNVEMFPTNLTKFTLIDSKLEQDPMPILERLQSLRILKLMRYSYTGTKLICLTEGFPCLQKLVVELLPKLCYWEIEEGAMPVLSQLQVTDCYKLEKVPTLQDLIARRPLKRAAPDGPSGCN